MRTGRKGARLQRCKRPEAQGCKTPEVQEARGARVQGSRGARGQRCQGARLQRCKAAYIYIYNYIHNKINRIKLICRDSKNNI